MSSNNRLHIPGQELEDALSELEQLRKDSKRVDRLADRIKRYIEVNHFAESLVSEIMQGH